MQKMKLSRQFVVLLVVMFALIIVFAVRLTRQFSTFSAKGVHLTSNLQKTYSLNQEMHVAVQSEIDLLHHQFEEPNPHYIEELNEINFHLGQKIMQYLKLELEDPERFAVERIRALHSELGVQSSQIFQQMREGNRDWALRRTKQVEELSSNIEKQFSALDALQVRKLQDMLDQLNNSVQNWYKVIYSFAAFFLLVLLLFTFLLRRRVLEPVHKMLEATNKIRLGDFTVRAPVARLDEIGLLAHEFNFMAETLAVSYADLEQKVQERTQQLQELQQQFVQTAKMSAMGRLVGGVAHELNNPLTVILGFTELERMKLLKNQGDPKRIKLMDDIHFQGERCRRIVANLLQVARRQEPHLETIRINTVVEQVLELREYELKTGNIQVVRDFDGTNPALLADPQKIQQVVLNLLNNAVDAIHESGRAGRIQVKSQLVHSNVILEVWDNGTGILEPDQVFDPFYTTKDVGKGTGLGLSVCYGIVKEHGGEIRAENWQGGARFIVTLPVGDIQNGSSHKRERSDTQPSKVKLELNALIVDDEEPIVDLQIAFLSSMGIHAVGIKSGEEAMKFLQTHSVDLVISDIRMPGPLDGVQLYEWICDHCPKLKERFLFISGDIVALDKETLARRSNVPSIQKPFQFENYSRLIHKLLNN
jgi:C4-dicarboxylate-specific signal transduction histidine kinase/CheY-like chemotaxis protein